MKLVKLPIIMENDFVWNVLTAEKIRIFSIRFPDVISQSGGLRFKSRSNQFFFVKVAQTVLLFKTAPISNYQHLILHEFNLYPLFININILKVKFWMNKEKLISGIWTCNLRIDVPVLYQMS